MTDKTLIRSGIKTLIYQTICVLIVAILPFISGVHSTWTSPVIEKLSMLDDNPFGRKLTTAEISWIGSLLPLGAVFGPFLSAYCARKLGKKITLIGIGVVYVIAILLLVLATNIYFIYAGRAIAGLSHGSVFTVVPLYLAEISKNTNRGIIGNAVGLSAIIGSIYSYGVGPYVPLLLFNVIYLVFPCLFVAGSFFLPESPTFLILKGDKEQARQNYFKLGIGSEGDFLKMSKFVQTTQETKISQIFKSSAHWKPFLLILLIASAKQLSGSSTISTYTQSIFNEAGSDIPSDISSILVGVIECSGALTAPFIIDIFGRRIMVISSMACMIISLFFVGLYFDNLTQTQGVSWMPLAFLVTFKFSFGFGIVSIVWILMAELVPSKMKSKASAIVNSVYWLWQFVLTFLFPILTATFGMGIPFWIFAACNLAALIVIVLMLPETKGKSPAEIEQLFRKTEENKIRL